MSAAMVLGLIAGIVDALSSHYAQKADAKVQAHSELADREVRELERLYEAQE